MIFLVSITITAVGYAQDNAVDTNNNVLNALATYGPDGANIGASSIVRNPARPIDGTVYLFEKWSNNGVIVTTKNKDIRIRNINFNAKRNVFESKIGNTDSIFTFDFTNIEKILVNNRTFKNVYSPVDGGYRVFEVVTETDDFEIYKDYTIDIREGNPNPLLARANDKYIMRDGYYAKRGKSFKRLKLKKSEILKMAGSKSSSIEKYAKENNLNFKNERDLQKIASYYRTL